MTLILAFDQSIKRTGWCVAEANDRGKVFLESIKFGSFTSAPQEHMTTERKTEIFGEEIKRIFDRERPHFVAFEAAKDAISSYPKKIKGAATKTQTADMFASRSPKAETKLAPATVNASQLILRDIQGQIRQACIERSLFWAKPAPSTWRADLFGTGFGNMEKDKVKAHAKTYCHRSKIFVENGDQAEAVCIAIWAATCSEFRWMLDEKARRAGKAVA